ncbi:MAG: GNAT family N-acetyltransferase [Roseibium sp.]
MHTLNKSIELAEAKPANAPEILKLQRATYMREAERYKNWSIAPLVETRDEFVKALETNHIIVARIGSTIAGSIRAREEKNVCHIGRLFVTEEFQGRGIGSALVQTIEDRFSHVERFSLFTGHLSDENIRLYRMLGYEVIGERVAKDHLKLVVMEKLNSISSI